MSDRITMYWTHLTAADYWAVKAAQAAEGGDGPQATLYASVANAQATLALAAKPDEWNS